MPGVDAVIFDWGGTLTRWHDIDFHAESLALAQAVVNADHDVEVSRQRLHEAGDAIWGRSRDHQQSATVDDLFAEAGLDHDPDLLGAYYEFWEPHTGTDPEVRPLWEALREDGIKVGVLSNTIWPRAFHEQIFERDGVLDLIDGDVYTSEIPWTKPSPKAFAAAMEAVERRGPGTLRLRRRPALRRHLGRPQRRAAGHPHPAQPDPGRAARAHRGRAGRGRAPALRGPRHRRRLGLSASSLSATLCIAGTRNRKIVALPSVEGKSCGARHRTRTVAERRDLPRCTESHCECWPSPRSAPQHSP